jgi:hypothetical protein
MRNNHATKKSQSGTFAIELPAADPLRRELERRLQEMPTAELVQLLRDTVPPPPASATLPSPAPHVETPTVRALIRRVLGRSSMRSQDVVAAVQQLRPGTPAPTVRSDLSRMRAEGVLRAVGPVRGGKLRVG